MKKKIILTMIVMIIFMPHISAARNSSLAIGVKYSNDHTTTQKAEMFNSHAANLGYVTYLDVLPTKNTLISDYNNYSNNGGILFFAGEGRYDSMYWNYLFSGGNYAVGITTAGNYCGLDGYNYYSIDNFKMSKTDLVFFLGCNTGNLDNKTSNLVYISKEKGAKVAIGWKTEIRDDAALWVDRFMSKIEIGSTIGEAINYADNYIYPSSSTKAYYINAGNYVNYTLSQLRNNFYNNVELEANKVNISKIDNTTIHRFEKDINVEYLYSLIKEIDANFNPENFEVEYIENNIHEIYDFVYIMNDYRTNIGYTIFIEKDNIVINNNMKGINLSILKSETARKTKENNNFKKYENETLEKYKKDFENNNNKIISLDSCLKRYDVENNKYYYDVNVMIYDKILDTKYISTETYEL